MASSKGRRAYRLYAQHLGKEATSFVEIVTTPHYEFDVLKTKNSNGEIEETSLDYKDMINFLIREKHLRL